MEERDLEIRYDDRGNLLNGFDYDLQVWVCDGIIMNCSHPERMRPGCCNADRLHGRKLSDIERKVT